MAAPRMAAFRSATTVAALRSGSRSAHTITGGRGCCRQHVAQPSRPLPPFPPSSTNASARLGARHWRSSLAPTTPSRLLLLAPRSAHTQTTPEKASGDGRRRKPAGPTPRGSLHRPDAPTSPFAELEIKSISEKVGGVRVRQHANPLRREFQVPAKPLDWEAEYAEPGKPLALDLGCGYGRFLLMLNRHMGTSHNYLGIELRQPIVKRANLWAEELGQHRQVTFMHANGTVSLESILSTYPGELALVSIQFPDPHFKKRHHKRRIVQPELVEAICRRLRPGGRVFMQSDVEEVAAAMRDQFERHAGGLFELASEHTAGECFSCSAPDDADIPGETSPEGGDWESSWAAQGWMAENPLGVPTEREVYVTQDKLPVYRIMLQKRD